MNTNTLINRLLPQLHATAEANLYATNRAELLEIIDESLKRLARKVLIFVARNTSLQTADETATYTLPERHIATLHVAIEEIGLIASSTSELEALDEAYKTTAGAPQHWYGDGEGFSKFGLYPVPEGADEIEIIEQEMPAEISELNLSCQMPAVFDDYVQALVLRRVYTKESDIQMPEVAGPLDQLISIYEATLIDLYGKGQ